MLITFHKLMDSLKIKETKTFLINNKKMFVARADKG